MIGAEGTSLVPMMLVDPRTMLAAAHHGSPRPRPHVVPAKKTCTFRIPVYDINGDRLEDSHGTWRSLECGEEHHI